jgi:hypothetical protein
VSEGAGIEEPTAVQRSASAEPARGDGGLLFTLRRLVRPRTESEADAQPEPVTEPPAPSDTPLAAPAIAQAASPEPPSPAPKLEEQPVLQASIEYGVTEAPELEEEGEEALPAYRALASPEMTLRRSRQQAAGVPTESEEDDVAQAAAPPMISTQAEAPIDAALNQPPPDEGAAPLVARAAGSRGRLPRIMRFFRRSAAPREDDFALTLARPSAATGRAAATPPPQRSTFNVETGRSEVMEAALETGAEATAVAVARTPAAEDAARAVIRRTARQGARQAPAVAARSEAALVYRARAAEGQPAGAVPAIAPGSMTTLELSPQAVAQIRRATTVSNSVEIARAEAPAAPGGDGGPGEEAPQDAGPAAEPVSQEAEGEKKESLETLARRVYDRLRARLLIERERAGFGAGMISR